MPHEGEDLYGKALELRVPALERVFGKHEEYYVSPIPFYFEGNPTLVGFPNAVPGAVVYCTSEMTGGWGSGQKPGVHGEYEFVIVVERGGPLAPKAGKDRVGTVGHAGDVLYSLAKYSTTAELRHGATVGPLHPDLAPMTNVLLLDMTNPKRPFEFGGRSYGLMLVVFINEAEFGVSRALGSTELASRLRGIKTYPISSLSRPSVA